MTAPHPQPKANPMTTTDAVPAEIKALIDRLRAPLDWGHFVSDDAMLDYAALLDEAAAALEHTLIVLEHTLIAQRTKP